MKLRFSSHRFVSLELKPPACVGGPAFPKARLRRFSNAALNFAVCASHTASCIANSRSWIELVRVERVAERIIMEVEEGPPIVKAASDFRSYKLIKLRNGLAALLIYDPEVADVPEEEENDEPEDMDFECDCAECDDEQEPYFPFDWPQFQSNCTGIHFVSPIPFSKMLHFCNMEDPSDCCYAHNYPTAELGGEDFMSEMKLRLRYHPGNTKPVWYFNHVK